MNELETKLVELSDRLKEVQSAIADSRKLAGDIDLVTLQTCTKARSINKKLVQLADSTFNMAMTLIETYETNELTT